MGRDDGLESGLTRFLNAMYRCFHIMSKFLIFCQFCECKIKRRKRKPKKQPISKTIHGENYSSYYEDDDNDDDDDDDYRGFTFPKRYILAIMTFLGFVNMYALRVNLNVAIGAMVNNHTVQIRGMTFVREAEFKWNSTVQGLVLGSFYYGYAFLQIPGAWLALKFGGTRIFGYAIFLASMFTLLTPIATRASVSGLIAVRAAEGLVLGAVFPCNHAIWSKWAPPSERTTLVTLAIAGCHVGTIITMPLSGLLTRYGFDGGWASVFYCFGAVGILWFVAWQLIVHESPDHHPTISNRERKYIERHSDIERNKCPKVPWEQILTSRPVWAIIAATIAADWGLYTILISLPLYLVDVRKIDIQTMGFLAAAPFLVKAISGPVGGITADLLRRRRFSTAAVRQLYYAVGAVGAGMFIVAAGYAKTAAMAMFLMCMSGALSGMITSGYNVNMLDIAPPYACIIMGLCNTLGTSAGFLSPMLVGYLTPNKDIHEWHGVFWVTLIVYIVGTVLFCTNMSADVQRWAIVKNIKPDRDPAVKQPLPPDNHEGKTAKDI